MSTIEIQMGLNRMSAITQALPDMAPSNKSGLKDKVVCNW